MPTGLTDVTVAIYVRGRRKSEKEVRGPEAGECVCVCVCVCVACGGRTCVCWGVGWSQALRVLTDKLTLRECVLYNMGRL